MLCGKLARVAAGILNIRNDLGCRAGELNSLEDIVASLAAAEPPLLRPAVVSALWQHCDAAHRLVYIEFLRPVFHCASKIGSYAPG